MEKIILKAKTEQKELQTDEYTNLLCAQEILI